MQFIFKINHSILLSSMSALSALVSLAYISVANAENANATASEVENAQTWIQKGEMALQAAQKVSANNNQAKNVILFVGDGMGVATITAARIFEGQQKGVDGEGNQLAFETLPYVALSKTYSANQQTPDSAPTMTAIITGVKTNDRLISVSQRIAKNEQDAKKLRDEQLTTILEHAELKGLSTGVISTARLTHATPAATYAHTSNRDWESNAQLPEHTQVKDIAAQLIDNFGRGGVGDGLEVALGGGRTKFLPDTLIDPEYADKKGERTDQRNLIQEYQQKFNAQYVWNKTQFDAIDVHKTQRLLGLFEPSHMQYEHDRLANNQDSKKNSEPSLSEMTSKAIDLLAKNKQGYFLMVEAGRIDHAHHAGNAYRALSETVALSDAVKVALSKVDLNNTLVIVTADHSHTFTIAGYPARGNPILGKVIAPGENKTTKAADGKPYTTLGYANGVGFHADDSDGHDLEEENVTLQPGRQANLETVNTLLPNYRQEANVPLKSETHGGEDVAIFAGGPKAHLFHGVQEQTHIFYVMKHALGL
jgi:alkaline phosphatase